MIANHYADVTEAISEHVDLFAGQMVQRGCCAERSKKDILGVAASTNYQKADKLLGVITSRIKTSQSKDNARNIFNCLVLVLQHKLKRKETAEALAAALSKSIVTLYNTD